MTLRIFDQIEQGTEAWHDQRRGMITASAVGRLITTRTLRALDYDCPACAEPPGHPCVSKAKKADDTPAPIKTFHAERTAHATERAAKVLEVADNDESRGLTALLVAERITGWTDPTYISDDMWRGINDEPRAREKYSEKYAPVTEVGFMVRAEDGVELGYSPDGLVGDDGLIEVKSRRPKKHVLTILADAVPAENMAQIQAGLLVSGREWCDYISYAGGMPMWRKRVEPDLNWFHAITEAVEVFEETAAEMVATYRERTVGLAETERVIEIEMSLS